MGSIHHGGEAVPGQRPSRSAVPVQPARLHLRTVVRAHVGSGAQGLRRGVRHVSARACSGHALWGIAARGSGLRVQPLPRLDARVGPLERVGLSPVVVVTNGPPCKEAGQVRFRWAGGDRRGPVSGRTPRVEPARAADDGSVLRGPSGSAPPCRTHVTVDKPTCSRARGGDGRGSGGRSGAARPVPGAVVPFERPALPARNPPHGGATHPHHHLPAGVLGASQQRAARLIPEHDGDVRWRPLTAVDDRGANRSPDSRAPCRIGFRRRGARGDVRRARHFRDRSAPGPV